MPSSSKYSAPATYYSLHLRFVRIQITDDLFEVLVTNLDENEFPPCILKQLYSMRWGIETSFRKLKYTIGLSAFRSKK
nr:transposase [Ruminococcus sp.]